MDKVRGPAILILCMFVCLSITIGDEGQQHVEDQSKNQSFWVWERLRSAYSIYSTVFSASTWQWQIFKRVLYQAYAHFFPPNLDFRRGDEAEAVTDGGAGEKVKAALTKSLGKSKATVEDTAKSAAKIAGETLQKTKEKVKKSLSDGKIEHQNEL